MRCNHVDENLDLRKLVRNLAADGLVSKQDLQRILSRGPDGGPGEVHPLVYLSDRRLTRATPPHEPLTLEALTSWLAKRVQVPYLRIDPLKIDVATVTSVVSYAYASRFKILPVEVNESEVVIATAEPFVTEWVEELERILRLKVTRVIANPSDISRYLVEFYALTESVKGAVWRADRAKIGGVINLEQLVELGRAGKLDANDRYVVNIVDWLLQYAFDQRASDIHLEPRRDNSDVRFRIDGVLHAVYQLPTVVMGAVVSRLKVLGRMDLAEKAPVPRTAASRPKARRGVRWN